MIPREQISVVVQGPIVGGPGAAATDRLTQRALASVRAHLPGAEIVLSTWQGSDTAGLSFDRLVVSDDPGTMRCDMARQGFTAYYNANRQIVSTRAGLRAATRPYAVKLRSDMTLTGTGFLRFFGRYPARASDWKILGERVVTADYFSRSLDRRVPHPFHPSDWFQFGRREDLLDLWDIAFADPEMVRWYDSHARPAGDPDWWLSHRFTVEQHNWLAFLAKHREHGMVVCQHKVDVSGANRRASELSIVNNLVVAGVDELGIEFLKYPISFVSTASLYTHGEWERLYRRYCDPAFRAAADPRLLMRRTYDRAIAPAHQLLISPRSSRLTGAVSSAWERRFPSSFGAAKRAYRAGLSLAARRPGR